VGIVEHDGLDPDAYASEFNIMGKFPDLENLGRESATERSVELGLQKVFVEKAGWLFYDHLEDKYLRPP